MNRGGVSAARVAHLYRQGLRRLGANIAIEAINDALDAGVQGGIRNELISAGWPAYHARLPALSRFSRFERRVLVAKDTRLARVNGWGSAGRCPAGHDAKKPAAQALVCGDAAAPNQRVYLAGVTVPGPMVGVSDE